MVGMLGQFVQGIDSYARDEDLVYYGNDPLVWDRINAERLRRGLPPLPNPRPLDPDQATPGTNDGAVGTPAEKEQLRQLESRREQLVEQVSSIQRRIFTNESTLARKKIEIDQAETDEDRQAIQTQINNLQSVVTAEKQRLAPLETQLTKTDQQVQSSISSVFPNIPGIPKLPDVSPATGALSKLKDTVISTAVSAANVLKQTPASINIPGLSTSQVTGMLSSLQATVGQSTNSVSSGGIGSFGLTPQQLEQQGFLKPGTVSNFLADGGDAQAVLSSPSVWTGKSGMTNLDNFTNNPMIQNMTQQNLMNDGLNKLKSLGVVNGSESPAQLASLVQSAGKFGPEAVAQWSKGQAPSDITTEINAVAKDAQQALKVVETQVPTLGALPFNAAGEIETVDREKIDTAFNSLLGSPKIPIPSFGGGGIQNLDQGLYNNTKDEDLTYTGKDPLVWDRINAERLRRGLPGLGAIGYPRPPEDSPQQSPTIFT